MRRRLHRLGDLLANEAWFWAAAAWLFAALALLKGVRLPSRWAVTQSYLDYREGFIKRGLLGEVLRLLHLQTGHYDTFVWVSAVLFLVLGLLLVFWIGMSGLRRLAGGAVVALFAASYGLTYLSQMLGYLEIPAGSLVLAVLFMKGRPWIVVIAGVLGILLHESYLLMFLPVTLLPMFLAAAERGSWRDVGALGVVLLIMGAVVVAVAFGASMTAQQVGKLQAAIAANVDFSLRGDFFLVLRRSAKDNLAIMAQEMGRGTWWLAEVNAILAFIPAAALFLWLAVRISAARQWALPPIVVKAVIVLVGLCPLALQLFGWDIYRWYALAQLTSFLTLSIVYWYVQPPQLFGERELPALRNGAILLIAINMVTGTTLFGGSHVDTFPFAEHWRPLLQALAYGLHWPSPVD